MARKLRVEFPGAIYHVMARGNERKDIFKDNRDKEFFISLFPRAFRKHGLLIHAFVLMDNHYHLLIETPGGNLSTIMKWLNVTYTSYFNWRHKSSGHLFQGRFKDRLVEKDNHMVQCSLYIHLNPFRAGMEERLGNYSFSSIKDYTRFHNNKDLSISTILGILSENTEDSIRQYKKLLQTEKNKKDPIIDFEEIISGSKDFIRKIMSDLKSNNKSDHPDFIRLSRSQISPSEIISIVCEEIGTSLEFLNKKDKRNRKAKSISIYLIKTYTSLTNKKNGELFGISYSGVTQCCFRLEKQLQSDKELKLCLKSIQGKVESKLC
jgi:REP element-mobilizing transposase RayT